MGNYQPTYLGELSLDEDTLAHYGVKGMRWRRRKAAQIRSGIRRIRRRLGLQNQKSPEQLKAEYDNWTPNTKEERMAYVTSRALQDRTMRRASSRYDIGSGGFTNSRGVSTYVTPEETESYRPSRRKKKTNKR